MIIVCKNTNAWNIILVGIVIIVNSTIPYKIYVVAVKIGV